MVLLTPMSFRARNLVMLFCAIFFLAGCTVQGNRADLLLVGGSVIDGTGL